MTSRSKPDELFPQYTPDAGKYLNVAGAFLRRRPVEHSVLLSSAAASIGVTVADPGSNLWLWVKDDVGVVAAAQHTPPHGVYLSTGPARAMRSLARMLWRLRPGLPGVAGTGAAPQEFAAEWARLGGPGATTGMRQGVYAAHDVSVPSGVPGELRRATDGDAPLLRIWAEQFFAEAGATPSGRDEIGPRIDAGRLSVWEVNSALVSMASVTPAQGDVSRVALVYTPPQHRKRGFASACVASLTARELAIPGRTCMLFTDLTNPTSNGIYRAIGYRGVGEAVDLRFAALPLVHD